MTAPVSGSVLTAALSGTVCILDAGPLLAYLFGEPGDTIVGDSLADATNSCYAHAVTIAEVYYVMLRRRGEAAADKAIAGLKSDGVRILEDIDAVFMKDLAKLKARGNLSIADCFCIAVASRRSGVVLTTDHSEFGPLVSLAICPIYFIRPAKTK